MKEFYKKIIFFLDLLVFYLYESSDFPNIILITRKKKNISTNLLLKVLSVYLKKKKFN
ncbi:hypothetical protein CPARA_1gp077 (nucleomorph) [Cryptomonas paramecium]|uniref:Uncharacterized protein n=1 Tax=Cryptomonas paramaecium TaxID=2898 RepID=F2HHD9_9CRYP|nr:hypothetical protein CPARA_1gp077 [Cryptomonas paramecium]AEA38735.1 hypothetical protein CPARA_1gp077 [Cryptomonas paramecium]